MENRNSSGANYTTQNMPGTVKSEGIEFVSNLKLNSSSKLRTKLYIH